MLYINGNGFSKARDFGLERMYGMNKQGMQHDWVHRLLFMTEPSITRHHALYIQPIGQILSQLGPKAQFQDEQ
jgi:hypothetical protein